MEEYLLKSTHIFTHAIIAILIQLCVSVFIVFTEINTYPVLSGMVVVSCFYSLRELYQYFIKGKTHLGRFDWGGLLSPIISTSIVVFIYHILFGIN